MEVKSYTAEVHSRATNKLIQMSKIAQHIDDLLSEKKYTHVEFWGLIWDDLESDVESLLLIEEALG